MGGPSGSPPPPPHVAPPPAPLVPSQRVESGQSARAPLSPREIRTLLIVGGAAALWLTDALHHWHPVIPALIAWICLLAPGIGVITWNDFEQGFGWANLFV